MNLDWKDVVIVIFLGVISILSFFTLVDWVIVKESAVGVEIVVSFIGAILGGVISGGLTLLGVKLTLNSSTEQVYKTLTEQQRIREEELKHNAIKEQLYLLYHPLYSLINLNHFKYGAHDFEDLAKDEKLEFIDLISKNEIYAEKELYIKILEIVWAFNKKNDDYTELNQLYHDIGDIVTDTISLMKDQLRLPNRRL